MSSAALKAYKAACKRDHAAVAAELAQALESNAKVAALGQRAVPLNDVDLCCIAEALRALDESSELKVLNLEENAFGLLGVQSLMEALEANPNHIRELRLGKNNLKDQAAVVIGHALSRGGCGLKVLDLSENGITKLGVIPIAAALENPTSDIVELSFHNNKIEGDAAPYLGAAIRAAAKLKHLHLGYNALRDSGAEQLAQSIPKAKALSTLDLTANRVGNAGGQALAAALQAATCTVQRLNLRHNLMDSEGIERFGPVLAKNKSLIQLFLGFMNPTAEAATTVLRALRTNETLLLIDIFGWKLAPKKAQELIEGLQRENTTLAAVVTDACQPIVKAVDAGNAAREERALHPIYVGPDDRDAYLATKSLRRFSRAQSRRQSRASSTMQSRKSSRNASQIRGASQPASEAGPEGERKHRHRSRSHGPSEADASEGRRHRHRSHSRGASEADAGESRHRHRSRSSRPASEAAGEDNEHKHRHRSRSHGPSEADASEGRRHRHRSHSRGASEADAGESRRRHSRSSRAQEEVKAPPPPPPQEAVKERALVARPLRICDSPARMDDLAVEGLLRDLQGADGTSGSGGSNASRILSDLVRNIREQARRQSQQHEEEIAALRKRVEALERRKECRCGSAAPAAAATPAPAAATTTTTPTAAQAVASQPNSAPRISALQNSPGPLARSGSVSAANTSINYFSSNNNNNHNNNMNDRAAGGPNTSLPASAIPYRSTSRMSEQDMQRCMTPLVRPERDLEDMPPDVAQGNDAQGERRPEEPLVQRSASVVNFPPRIEPSPSRDMNPPRRKSVSHAL